MIPIRNKKDLETIINEVRDSAYSYLDKYSPSKQQLKTHLLKKFLKNEKKITNKKRVSDLIDIIIIELQNRNFLNDSIYSDSKTKAYLKRGYSLNKIRYNLIKKGIEEKFVKSSISKIKEDESDPDFFSAIKLCKKRRIGAFREENNRSIFYKKDIGILARAGFSYEISKKVLDLPRDEFNKFIKFI